MRATAAALMAEWGHRAENHPEVLEALEVELSGALIETAADVMREHGLPDLRVEPEDAPEPVWKCPGCDTNNSRRTDVVPPLDLVPGTLLVAVGPGASGKSTFAGTAAVDVVISLDSLRREIGGDAGDQSVTPAAVARQNELLEQYLRVAATVLVDSTNVEVRVRAGLVELARRHQRPIVAVRFLPELATCLARNAARAANRRVPDDTLRWQHTLACEATEPTLRAEGFTAVHQVHPTPRAADTLTDRPRL